MLSLLMAASIGQCYAAPKVNAYGRTYATATYQTQAYQAPVYHNFVGFVALNPYYSSGTVGAAARAEAQAQVAATAQLALTTQLGTLAASIADLKAQVGGQAGGQAGGEAVVGGQSIAGQGAAPPPANTNADGPGSLAARSASPPPAPRGVARPNAPAAFVGVLANKCGNCHNPQKKSGGLSFFDAPGVLAALSIQDKLDMLDSVRAGRMPKTAEKGSPEARRAIAEWIQADAEQLIASLKENQRK